MLDGHQRQQQTMRLNVLGGDGRHRAVAQDVAVLRQLVAQHEVAALAVGLPLDLKGVEGSAVAGVPAYAQQICSKNVRTLKTPRNALGSCCCSADPVFVVCYTGCCAVWRTRAGQACSGVLGRKIYVEARHEAECSGERAAAEQDQAR